MANIIWSFGIALSAKDQASEPINDVISSINAMDRSLAELNERQIANVDTVRILTQDYLELNRVIGSLRIADSLGSGAEAVGDFEDSLDSFASTVGYALGVVTGGIGLLVVKAVQFAVTGVAKIISGIFSTMKFVLGTVVPGVVKVGFEIVKIVGSVAKASLGLAWSLAQGSVSLFAGLMNGPLGIAEKLVDTLIDLPNIVSRWVFGRNISELTEHLSKAYEATQKFAALGASFAPIDKALRQTSALTGKSTKDTNALISSIIGLGIKTGLPIAQLTELTTALAHTGQNIEDLDEKTQVTMGHLATTFGLGVNEALNLRSAAMRLGRDINELADIGAAFGKQFGIAGVMEILPEVVNTAANAMVKFGKGVVGDEKRIVESSIKTSAAISKAFGRDIKVAAGQARESFEGFAGEVMSQKKLMLGLTDSITPLRMSFLQAGMGWQGVTDLMKQGQEHPEEVARKVRQLNRDLLATGQNVRAERFMTQMREQLTGLSADLTFTEGALDKFDAAQKTTAELASSNVGVFNEVAGAMRASFTEAEVVFNNVKTAIYSIFQSLFTEDMAKTFTELKVSFSAFGSTLKSKMDAIVKDQAFVELRKIFGEVVTLMFKVGEGAGAIAPLGGVIATITGLLIPFKVGLEVFRDLSGLSSAAGFSLTSLFHNITKGVSIFGMLRKTVEEVGKILGDDSGFPGMLNKLGGILPVILGNFADYFDTFFLGIPTRIVKAFSVGVDKEKSTFRTVIMGLFSKATVWIKETLSEWNSEIPADLNKTFSSVGKLVGEKVGQIAKTIGNFVKGLFDEKQRKAVFERLFGLFDATEAEKDTIAGSLLSIAKKVGSAAKGFLVSFTNGVLGAFGTNISLAFDSLSIKLRTFANSAKVAFYGIADELTDAFKGLITILQKVASGVSEVGKTIFEARLDAAKILSPMDASGYEKAYDTQQEKGREVGNIRNALVKAQTELENAEIAKELSLGEGNNELVKEKKKEVENLIEKLRNATTEAKKADKDYKSNPDYEKFRVIEGGLKSFEDGINRIRNIDTSSVDNLKSGIDDKLRALKSEGEALDAEQKANASAQSKFIAEQKAASDKDIADTRAAAEKKKNIHGAMWSWIERRAKMAAEALSASKGSEATASVASKDDNVRSNYLKMIANTNKNQADIWLMSWMSDNLDPGEMPQIPESDKPKAVLPVSTTETPKPGTPTPTAAASRMVNEPETLPYNLGELFQSYTTDTSKPEPSVLKVSFDSTGFAKFLRFTLNGEMLQDGQ